MTKHKWDQVTVVGCGLIGSSFALALRRSGACERILGWDSSPAALKEALAVGAIDGADQNLAAGDISASDLVYLAMPVLEIVRFLREHGSEIRHGAIITDAGSTKMLICDAAAHLPAGFHFIGGHPIAGSHLSSAAHARADLFEDTTYVLTTDYSNPNGEPFTRLQETIEGLGARLELMTAADHDRTLALVSHLPQLVSSALAATVRTGIKRSEVRDQRSEVRGGSPSVRESAAIPGGAGIPGSEVRDQRSEVRGGSPSVRESAAIPGSEVRDQRSEVRGGSPSVRESAAIPGGTGIPGSAAIPAGGPPASLPAHRDELSGLAGEGYRDMTRLAASSWAVWRDILSTNPKNIAAAIDLFMEKLCAVRDELQRSGSDLDAEFPATQVLFNKH